MYFRISVVDFLLTGLQELLGRPQTHRFIGSIASQGDISVFNVTDFPWTRELRLSAGVILDEFKQYQERLPPFIGDGVGGALHNADGKWRTLWLRIFGQDTQKSSDFPETQRILKSSGYASAMFSVFEAGKRVKPHRGNYRGVLRYLLVLEVPPGSDHCAVTVVDAFTPELIERDDGKRLVSPLQRLRMETGADYIFDDTFLHASTNDRKGRRINLFLDFPRPDLPMWADLANRFLLFYILPYAPLVKEMVAQSDGYRR